MTNQSIIFLLTFLCVFKLSFQCLPPFGWNPPSIGERTRRAPLVVRASLKKKINAGSGLLFKRESLGPMGSYTACLSVTHVYKGVLPAGDICASGFGEPVFCKTDLAFGVSYVIFLNTDPLSARYEFITPAAVPYSETVFAQVGRGVCCPEEVIGIGKYIERVCALSVLFIAT